MSDDAERDDHGQGDGNEESGVFHLDLDDDEPAKVDDVTREAVEAVSRAERRAAEEARTAAERNAMIAQLEEELADLRDRSIRTLADFENFRRRTERERADLQRRVVADTLQELLPVLDNLERAMESAGSVEDLKAGVEMIVRQLREVLRQNGVEDVPALGEPFDPAFHDAVAREVDPGVEVATVAEELQRGYTIGGRLLRPAMVRVAVPSEDSDEN